jgi:sedoheptulokinase
MLIGIDIGTTTVSGIRVDPQGPKVSRTASRENRAEVAGLQNGWHEQHPEEIFDAVRQVVLELADCETGSVEGIALTGQMHGLVAVDENLRPLTNLITWRDRRTADYPEETCRHIHASETGCFLHAGYGGLTLHYLLGTRTLPGETFKVLSIPGYVAARLTGRCAIDETLAASWGIWDLCKNDWHDAMLAELGIPRRLLPEFVPSCTAMGRVADSSGLPGGAMVFSPVGDNQAGVAAALESRTSAAVVNIGTSSQLSVPLREVAFNPKLETRPFPNGRFIQVFAALCGGWSYAYLADFFRQVIEQVGGRPIELQEVYAGMERLASVGSANSLLVDTRFAGERNGDSRRTGSVSGITTQNLLPQNLVCAFAEGIVGELAEAAALADMRGVERLAIVGNAVRMNPILQDALKALFGLPCEMMETPEEAAFGAVLAVLQNQNVWNG